MGILCIEEQDGVAQVRLDRPEKLNALDMPMFEALVAAGEKLAAMSDVRAVVLSGEGRAFCAGLDIASFAGSLALEAVTDASRAGANIFQHAALLWRALPVPVIAAIHGVCLGAGLQIALGADIRILAPDARLAFKEIEWGLMPDMAAFVTSRGLLRDDVLRELALTGRMVAADEACALGLGTRVAADPVAEALALARVIASHNPDAVRRVKALCNLRPDSDREALLGAERAAQAAIIASPKLRDAISARLSVGGMGS